MGNQSSALDILLNRMKETGTISTSPKSTTTGLSKTEEEERFRKWQAEAEAARAVAEAKNQNIFERAWNTVTGGVKGWAGNQAGFFGNIAEGLSRLGERLGGNTSDYAGWATDEMTAGQVGMENDPVKRAQQLAESIAMQETGNRWSTSGSQDIERAKAGLGFWGGLAVDTGANAVQMGLDSLTSALTGGGGALVPLFTRAAGGAMQEAAEDGAGLGQRLLYGGTVGSIEAATEKLFGGLAKIYGRGTAEGMVESVVRRLTGSAAGQKALLVMADMGGEAIEELISNVANPAAKTIYNGKSLGESYRENFSVEDALYDALVGGIMGGLGAGTKVFAGDYRNATQRMGITNKAEAALRDQWGTDKAGRRASTEYAELIGRGVTGGLSTQELARLETKPTAASIFVRDSLDKMFQKAGTQLSDAELDVLANGYATGTSDVATYLSGVANAYQYGKLGLTLEQARKSAEKTGSALNPVQLEHAFRLGEAESAETADTTTEAGRTKVLSYLSKLGNQAEAAADVYDSTQDVQKYAEAMGKAVQLFAANGGDLKSIWNDAKAGKVMSSISYLTEKQIETAQELGAKYRTEQAESASRREAAFAEKRAKLETLLKKGGNAAEYVDSTLATQRHISQLREDIRGTAEGLELARKSEPGIVNTAEYKAAVERLNGLRKDLQGATELQKRLKKGQERAIGKKPGRKKGKVVYADKAGNASGIEYQAVDRSKLSKTQQATTRIAEAIADATGLEIRIISVPTTKTKGVGGEYIPGAGGVMYLNIDMTVDGKNMAAGSLFHELTHWIQEYAPEKYEELKRFVLQESQKDPEKFEDIFNARNRTSGYKTLSVDQVTDEMVANACMRIFEDPEAVKRLAVQHKGLWETIRDFIVKFVDDVKAAFAEMDFSSDFNLMGESQLMVDSLEEMRDRFIDAFSTATENYQAEQIVGKENTATEGGVQMQLIGTREDGIEVYETSEEVKKLPWKQKRQRFMDLMMNEYRGRTAKFTAGNQVYYAKFASDDLRKNIYGDMNSDDAGRDAKVNAGADGDIFDLVENSRYRNSLPETGKDSRSHRGVKNWNYFVKTVQIDGTVFDLIANVREKSTGEFVYSLQLNENKNIEAASPDTRPNQGELNGAPTASKDSIAGAAGPVKKNPRAKYQLIEVEPVQPTTDEWERTHTTAEALEAYPNLWNVAAEESETRNPTQIASTQGTYRKIYNILKSRGFQGKILDASSGLGYGTKVGREEFGFDVDDIEPYPDKGYKPKYTDYSKLDEKYDAIISSAVLNVLPQDQRDALVVKMGELLNPGGTMYITTRGNDVENLAKTGKNIHLGPMEWIETVKGSYQKGFTQDELKAYLEDALGDDFIVEKSNRNNGGKFNNNTSIVVTKKGGAQLQVIDAGNSAVEIDPETESANVQFSLFTWEESDYVQDRNRAAKEIAKALGITEKKARDYIDSINSVAKIISDNKVRLDYLDTGRSPFVGNTEYGGSFDFTTLCKKRRLLTGTFSAIQRALPNTALTAQEILEIRKMMDDAGLEVSCGKCYVEGSRASMGTFTNEFLKLYEKYNPGAWVPNMAEMNTPDGIEWVRQTHPEVYEQYEYFWNHYGTLKPGDPNLFASQQKPKLYHMRSAYKGEVLTHFRNDGSIAEKNRNGGMRMQSFSDFEIVHLIDAMQVIMDMSRVGLNGQAYTKVPDFAWALGKTGLKINLSIDAWSVDENGKLVFNNKEGMNFDEAMRIRDANSENVGTICCVYDDAQLLAALADDRIDFIIPFHRSQWKKSQYKAMGLPATTKDYTYQQNEKWLDPKAHTHEYRGRQVPDHCTNYMPNTYWDYSKSGKENAEEYLRMCARDGKRPKFYRFLTNNGDGSFSLKEDGSTDGYWKLLIDFKMYDNEGRGVPQRPVRPDFNMKEINRMLNSYEGGHNQFPVAQGIVDEFVQKYKDGHKGQAQFQMINEVEETDKLIAVHNKTMSGLRRMIDRGGVPFPSIAIKKAGSGHNHYGPVSIVFGRSRIDPEVNRANRIYGGDAWTPTEPRAEYEADSKKAYKIREQIYKAVGSQTYEALRTGGSLDNDEIERKLGDNEGNIFEAMKGTAVLKYAYLKSIGKEPEVPTREKRLDGFGRYTNEQLLNLFKTVGAARIHQADYSDQEFRQKAADILNEEFIKDFRKRKAARGASKEAIDAVVKSYKEKPVYVAGDISVNAIKDALRTFENDGRKLQKEPDSSSFTSAMRDNKEIEEDPGYRRWIEDLYSGIVKDSGIRNDKDPFTPSGSRRSFKQLHIPATLDNIAKIMGKQNEKGVASLGGSNLMGTGTKTYRTVEEARADRGRLYDGDYIDEEEFEGPKKALNDRLQELVEAAAKITSRDYAWEQRDSAREILLEAVRDSKTKAAMDRKLRNEAQWINYDPTLTDELWQLAEDTRNMKVPYFEAKLRRVVYPEEALAYIVEDTAEETDADLLKKMRDQGLNVLTYKAGDKEDRLRVLNSVEGAQFQRYDEQLEGQMAFFDVENSNMHPKMRERLEEATQLTEDIKAYFGSIPGSMLSAEDIEGMLDFDLLSRDATSGDMLDPGAVVDELLATVSDGGEYRRRQAYRLAERLIQHMNAITEQTYIGGGNTDRVQDKAFAAWYSARHPSLYYPGYQPGDLFAKHANAFKGRDNIQKEKDYLHGLLESGNLMEPELSGARELLDRMNNPQPKEVFYQQFSEAAEDERQMNRMDQEIAELEDLADIETDSAELRKMNMRLTKLYADRDRLIAKERKLSRKTSIDDILKNLPAYRYSDLESIAQQYSNSAWDIEPGTTREQLEDELREVLETLAADMTPLQRQAPAMGYYVRPVAPVTVSFQQYDDTYEDTSEESTGRELAYSRIQSENAILSNTVKELKKTVKGKDATIEKILKKLARAKKADAEKLARQIMREYSSKADLSEVTAAVKAVGDYYLQTPVEKLDEARVKELAREAATLIVQGAEETVETDNGQLREIRGSLEGQKVYIKPEFLGELDSYGGLKSVKNSLFGKRVYLSSEAGEGRISVDQLYEQLHADFGDYYFPEAGADNGPANEGEEIMIIADVLAASDSMTVNPFDAYMGEAVEAIANGIAFRVMNENVLRPLLPAEAEKAFDQLGAVTEENREIRKKLDAATTRGEIIKEELERLQQEGKDANSELIELRDQVYDLTSALKKADQRYSALQAESEQRIAQVREEGTARVAEVRAKERERAAKEIQGLKDHYKEIQKKARDRREESAGTTKYRKQVQAKAKALYEMLMKNDDKKHVPEVLKRPVAEFLESIDFTSKRQLRGGDETNADREFGARMRALERALSGQQDYIDGTGDVQEDLGGYVDISQENLQFLRDTIGLIDTALKENRDYTINQMSAAELKQLSNFLSNLNTAIRNLNSFMANARFESVREAAGQDIEHMKEMGDVSKRGTGKAAGFLMWENGTPYYVFKRFGKGGESIFDGLAKGWERMAFNVQEIKTFTRDLYTSKEVNEWKKKVHDITLEDGSRVKMTTAQIMELSMLLNREQARKHIEAGGIRIGDIDGLIQARHYHLSLGDIQKITGMLNARQREVAKALQTYMAKKGAQWGNEVSMRRFGYEFYTEGENYYPIKTDATDRPMSDTDAPGNASMFRLLNLSSSKSLNPHANNALVVGNIFDTTADHMSDMAKLNGMGLPILDAIKYFNYKEKIRFSDGTFDTETMQKVMQGAYGNKALSYFRKLMQDINGTTESGDRGDPGFGKLLSNYKIAAVGANLRVALLQPTSYVRATAVLKPQYMVGIVPSRAAYQEAIKYSGTAVWKSLGYYDTDIARGMRGQIQHDDTWKDKVAEASMKAAELGDQLTWSMLWTACKRQAKGENGSLQGKALMDRTADLFREVVYASQVMDSTLTRSEIMRGKTMYSKVNSSFMAEPTLSYNILLDAYSKYQSDVRRLGKPEAWKRNGRTFAKAIAVYTASTAFSAIMESIADAARDDDDEEYWDKVLQALLGEGNILKGNLAQDLSLVGKLPYVKNIISTLQGYKSGDMSITAFSTAIDAANIWIETARLNLEFLPDKWKLDKPTKATYYGKMTPWGRVYKALQAVSQLSGVAASNLTRDATAIWNTIMNDRKNEWKIRTYDGNQLSDESVASWKEYVENTGISKSAYKSIMSQADVNGTTKPTQDELGEYLVNALAAGEITEEQAQALWKSQWNKDGSKTFDKWRGKEEESKSTTSASTKTTSTVGSTAKKSSQPSGQIEGWDDFKTVAPIYGGPKREATYNAKPANMSLTEYTKMLQAADADGNKSLKQNELGFALKAAVQSGQISWEAAAAVWAAQGWSHDLSWWAAKHP